MAPKLIVHYFPQKCVGQGNCCSLAPDYFTLSDDKAVLKDAVLLMEKNEPLQMIEIDDDGHEREKLVQAGIHCPVNAIRVIDGATNKDLVDVTISQENTKELFAHYDDDREFVLDDKGYFLIRLDRKDGNIEVGFCNQRNKVTLKVIGKKPIDIYSTILNKEGLPIRKDHAAYLGRELQKAYIALNQKIEYIQDDELDFSKRVTT